MQDIECLDVSRLCAVAELGCNVNMCCCKHSFIKSTKVHVLGCGLNMQSICLQVHCQVRAKLHMRSTVQGEQYVQLCRKR